MIVIATDAAFPPFHLIDDNGMVSGYDIELARAVLRSAGYETQTVVRPYGELLPGLLKRRHDLVAATTGITPERQRSYLFSTPYFETCQAVLVRVGEHEPKTLGELAGRRVGAAGTGTSARALRNLPGVERVRLGKGTQGLPALLSGEIDALVIDEFEVVSAARKDSDRLNVLDEPAALESYGFVLAPDQAQLARQVNAALQKLRDDGTIARLKQRFGLNRDRDWPIAAFRLR